MRAPSRRRFLTILGSACALALTPAMAQARGAGVHRWRGVALGAGASIFLDDVDGAAAQAAISATRAEIERLEAEFSLYRPESALSRLNRTGALAAPSADMLAILSMAGRVHRATGGAFDPTVQPLWRRLAGMETRGTVAEAPIGFGNVVVAPDRIAFARAGMALTLNGIAQGYITDAVARLLRAHGFRHVLVDMGELAAPAGRRDGTPWPVTIQRRRDRARLRRLTLAGRALATSEPLATTLDRAGRIPHILDPRAQDPRSRQTGGMREIVAVEAGTAAIADALSTGLCLLDDAEIAAALAHFPEARLVLATSSPSPVANAATGSIRR